MLQPSPDFIGYFTRVGFFFLDEEGWLVNAEGYRLTARRIDEETGYPYGAVTGIHIPDGCRIDGISANGDITVRYSDGRNVIAFNLDIAMFDRPDALVDEGNELYTATAQSGVALSCWAGRYTMVDRDGTGRVPIMVGTITTE